jgi:hypothetical protein
MRVPRDRARAILGETARTDIPSSFTTAKCTDLPVPYVWFENSCSSLYFSLPLPVTFDRYPRDNGPSCYSDFYKRGGEYLLILFRQPDSTYSAPAALASLNEQLRGADDDWLRFVRDEVAKQQAP